MRYKLLQASGLRKYCLKTDYISDTFTEHERNVALRVNRVHNYALDSIRRGNYVYIRVNGIWYVTYANCVQLLDDDDVLVL